MAKKIKSPAHIATQSVAGGEQISIKNSGAKQEQIIEKENIFNSDGKLVIDVFETNSDFVVLTAIAGAHIKDIDISVEKDMMVIRGQRIDPHDNPEKKYFYQECYWGAFSRKIVLPENINTQAASAQMDKGLLIIKIPKINDDNKKEAVKLS